MKRLLFAAALCCAGMAQAAMVSGLEGRFALSNWTSVTDTGSIAVTAPDGPVVLTSGDDASGTAAFTRFFILFDTAATVHFDWNYDTLDSDPFFDPFGYVLSNDVSDLLNSFSQLSDDFGGTTQAGTQSVVVAAGQYFGFAAQSDNSFGAATTTVSGLRVAVVPEPGALALLAVALAAAAAATRRRRSM